MFIDRDAQWWRRRRRRELRVNVNSNGVHHHINSFNNFPSLSLLLLIILISISSYIPHTHAQTPSTNQIQDSTATAFSLGQNSITHYEYSLNTTTLTKSSIIYLTLSTCQSPSFPAASITEHLEFPTLSVHLSFDSAVRQPGPDTRNTFTYNPIKQKSLSSSSIAAAPYGYINVTIPLSKLTTIPSSIFIGISSPASTLRTKDGTSIPLTGVYTAELWVSTKSHQYELLGPLDPLFEDSDSRRAVLMTPAFVPWGISSFEFRVVPLDASGSFRPLPMTLCSVRNASSVYSSTITATTTSNSTNSFLIGSDATLRQRVVIDGLSPFSSYAVYFIANSSQTTSGTYLRGPIYFKTKTSELPCSLAFNLTFCQPVGYLTFSETATALSTIDASASTKYNNFTYLLSQYNCDAFTYSIVANCLTCRNKYSRWTCLASIPRCTESAVNLARMTTESWYVVYGNRYSTDYASVPPVDDVPNPVAFTEPVWNDNNQTPTEPGPLPGSTVPSNNILNTVPRKILPCHDTCASVVRNCPGHLEFSCPSLANSGLGYDYAKDELIYYGWCVGTRTGTFGGVVQRVWYRPLEIGWVVTSDARSVNGNGGVEMKAVMAVLGIVLYYLGYF